MSYRSSLKGGFTIVELMVSVGLMLVLTTVIAFNQSRYTSGAELKNLANNLGLSLRQAQIYGISVKAFSPEGGFNAGYGAAFNLSVAPLGDDQAYIFFADKAPTKNSVYDDNFSCPTNSECLDKVSLGANNRINDLCTIDNLGDDLDCSATRLDITFTRPAIEAKIVVNGDVAGAEAVKGARIELVSPDGKFNSVLIYVTGQISVR